MRNSLNMQIRLGNIKWYILTFLGGIMSSLILYFCIGRKTVVEEKVVYVRDTISIPYETIKYKERVKYVTQFDTIICVVRDSVMDTVRVELPIEHKQYRDTIKTDTTDIKVDIEYSGFKPQLDRVWIDYSYTGKQLVKSKKKGHFGQSVVVGVQVGYGVGINNPIKFNPYVGVGITYGFGYSW